MVSTWLLLGQCLLSVSAHRLCVLDMDTLVQEALEAHKNNEVVEVVEEEVVETPAPEVAATPIPTDIPAEDTLPSKCKYSRTYRYTCRRHPAK